LKAIEKRTHCSFLHHQLNKNWSLGNQIQIEENETVGFFFINKKKFDVYKTRDRVYGGKVCLKNPISLRTILSKNK
jgi:hypothetical protein